MIKKASKNRVRGEKRNDRVEKQQKERKSEVLEGAKKWEKNDNNETRVLLLLK